ncbi:MAG: potassium channel family protein [Nanoarchaeota archaeon]
MKIHLHIFLTLIIFLLFIFTGNQVYQEVEGWNSLDATYFTVITMTTIGYGDLYPQTPTGKIFTMFFSFFGIALAFYLIGIISSSLLKKHISNKTRHLKYYWNKEKEKEIENTKKHVKAGVKSGEKRKKKSKKKKK